MMKLSLLLGLDRYSAKLKVGVILPLLLCVTLSLLLDCQSAELSEYKTHPVLSVGKDATDIKHVSEEQATALARCDYDPNYLEYEPLERAVLKRICEELCSGELKAEKMERRHPANRRPLLFGFCQIPVEVVMSGSKCTSAKIVETDLGIGSGLSFVPQGGIEYSGRLKHPVLDACEFESMPVAQLQDWQLRQLSLLRGPTSYVERILTNEAHCYAKSEIPAARQFRDRVLSKTKSAIVSSFGAPLIKTVSVPLWGDKDSTSTNWVYSLGYTPVRVRLRFDGDKCTYANLLSEQEYRYFQTWKELQFGGMRAIGQYARVPAPILKYGPFDKSLKGASVQEIVAKQGEPTYVYPSPEGGEVYMYVFGHKLDLEVKIKNGFCIAAPCGDLTTGPEAVDPF